MGDADRHQAVRACLMLGMTVVRVHERIRDPKLNVRGYALMVLRTARRDCLVSIQQPYDLRHTSAVEQQ
jgi:hypothetical protein